MKKMYALIVIISLFSTQFSFSQVPQKIVVEHFTNSNCSICASRNPGFYNNLENQTGALHLAVHPSSPYSSCLLFQQNPEANDDRTNYYGIYGGTPRLVINGVVVPASFDYSDSSIFDSFESLTSPASIRIVQQKFGTDSITASIIIKTEAEHSLTDLSLFVALAEDTVFYTGTNGESQHYDVFRKSLSNTIGDPISLPATVGDSIILNYSSSSDEVWDFSRIFTMAILQETDSKLLVQAEAASPSSNEVTTGINENSIPIQASIFPNPADKYIVIQLDKRTQSTVYLSNISGKVILQKITDQDVFSLDISDVPAGIYFLNIRTGERETTQKIIKQ